MTLTLKDHVRGVAQLERYFDGDLWYVTESGFKFPVPTAEAGSAVFNREEKAMLLMRYIRRHMDMLAGAAAETQEESDAR